MKQLFTAIVAVGTLGLAAPAFAQGYGHGQDFGRGPGPAWSSVNAQQDRIERRIDRGLRDGSLTRPEARRLRGEFRDIQRTETRFLRNDGRIDRREQAELSFRLQDLNRQVFAERNDWQRRGRG